MLIDKDRDSSFPSLHLSALQTEPHLFRELGQPLFVPRITEPCWCGCNSSAVAGLHKHDGFGFSSQFCSRWQAQIIQVQKRLSVKLNKIYVEFPLTMVRLVEEIEVYCLV